MEVIKGIDVFIGVFLVNVFFVDDVKFMVSNLIVFVFVNLDFEISFLFVMGYVSVMVIGCLDYFN